ncbi:hypothetical protein HU200_016742 [Digitaria exilis]|uniref:Uncharacterized protein n=1 Tax=Digitaria exilis TaxID=1010633 RepID=A0A835KIF4_9POAL|nr:hypothetical protein HU200_016742 [Digitaria exilis]
MGVKQDLSMLQDIHGEVTSWLSAVRDRAMQADPSLGWVIKLRNLANDIYDLLDEVCLEDEKLKIDNNLDKHATSDSAQPWLHTFRDKVVHKVEEIKVTFDVIAKQRSDANAAKLNLDMVQLVPSNNEATRQQQSLLLSNVEESKIPSRDRVKSEIISKLVESNEAEGHIVSIVGLCGSGKTNLAEQICHDDKIKEHFKDTIFWIHISQEFCRDKLIGKVFEAITGKKSDGLKNQQIICAISNKLSGKESLLVFDDAWHEDRHDWEKFMVFLNGFVTLPNSIGKLSKLRTLELNCVSDLESLPESIGNCQNLQYLKVNYCEKFKEIPCSVGSMEKLRVLLIVRFKLLPLWVTSIGTLQCINLRNCKELVELPKGVTWQSPT